MGVPYCCSSRCKSLRGDGELGNARVRIALAAEKQAMIINIPRKPITGDSP